MRLLIYAAEERMQKRYRTALILALVFVEAILELPMPFAAGPTQESRPLSPVQVTAKKPEQKTAESPVKKPHRLIRRPTTGLAVLQPPAIEKPAPAIGTGQPLAATAPQSQDTSSVLPKDTSPAKGNPAPAFAAPLASPFIGQTASPIGVPAPKASTSIGSAASTTRVAAASAGSPTPSAPPSLRRLFAEIPGTAQIMAYEDPSPAVTTPTIVRIPTTMSFSAVQSGTAPTPQTLMVSNGGPGTLTWTASSNSSWLTLNGAASTTGSNAGSVNVAVNPSALTVGPHSGTITILSPGAANSPQSVSVSFDITAAPTPTIGLSTTSLSFSGIQGGSNPAIKTVSVVNSGSGTLNWAATESASWLSLSPASGTGAGTITLSVTTAGMTAGTYSAPITIAATGATNTPQTITVTLTLTAPGTIGLSPTTLNFTAIQGGSNPINQGLTISNTGGGTLSWTVSDDATWLTPSPTSGTGTGTSTISINTTGLATGTYNATISIASTGATNSPRTIPVTLTVSAPTSSSATLTWNANTDSDLQGYKVYKATTSGAYVGAPLATLPAGTVTYQATGLLSGTTYFFVVTAYDTAGNESVFSTEVSKSIF